MQCCGGAASRKTWCCAGTASVKSCLAAFFFQSKLKSVFRNPDHLNFPLPKLCGQQSGRDSSDIFFHFHSSSIPSANHKSNRLIWLDSGRSPRMPSVSKKLHNRLTRLGNAPGIILTQKTDLFSSASTMASAAFSPRPSMLFNDGMILPSMIWKFRECALNKSMGQKSQSRAHTFPARASYPLTTPALSGKGCPNASCNPP